MNIRQPPCQSRRMLANADLLFLWAERKPPHNIQPAIYRSVHVLEPDLSSDAYDEYADNTPIFRLAFTGQRGPLQFHGRYYPYGEDRPVSGTNNPGDGAVTFATCYRDGESRPVLLGAVVWREGRPDDGMLLPDPVREFSWSDR